MRNLFKYYLKKRISVTAIITIICLVVSTVYLDVMDFVRIGSYWVEETNSYYETLIPSSSPLGMIAIFAAILVIIIPVFEFYFKMRKINVDQMYSLPVKRSKLYIVKYIIGLAEIIIPITISYIYCVVWVACSKHMFDMIYFLPFYFSLIGVIVMTYTILCFIYTRANTFFDGLILIGIYMFVLPFLFISVDHLIESDMWSYSFIYSPFFSITRIFNALLKHNALVNTPYYAFDFNGYMIYAIVLNFVTSLIFGFLFFYLNPKDKAENAFERSTSWFSYKVLIPVITCVATIAFAESSDYIIPFIIAVIAYLLLAIYHRSFKVSWKELVFMAAIIICSTFISVCIAGFDKSISIATENDPYSYLLLLLNK